MENIIQTGGTGTEAEPRTTWRVRLVPDELEYDDSYLECQDLSPEELAKARRELWATIEREGVWILVSEVTCCTCGTWNVHDSCCAIIGAPDDESIKDFVTEVQAEAARLYPDI